MSKLIKISLILLYFLILSGCGGLSKTNTREVPTNAMERARKNVEEGKGASIGSILGRGGRGTSYEFSSSNPMWRASLEILDFLPMTTVDYSGGIIISDWYTENNLKDEAIKISIRFLSNEVRSDSLKIIVHKKLCTTNQNFKITLLNSSKISEELRGAILRQAALFEIESKKKKK